MRLPHAILGFVASVLLVAGAAATPSAPPPADPAPPATARPEPRALDVRDDLACEHQHPTTVTTGAVEVVLTAASPDDAHDAVCRWDGPPARPDGGVRTSLQ